MGQGSSRRTRRSGSRQSSQAGGGALQPYSSPSTDVSRGSQGGNAADADRSTQTTTVRNLVNLKKQSLKLTPRENAPNVLDISFTLDVVQRCRVSILLVGKEDRSSGKITSERVICNGAECEAGMNIQFPFPGLSLDESSISTADFSTEQLNSADVKQYKYPLFVRLETIAPGLEAEGNSLDGRDAGAPLAPWIQAQTTYIVLGTASEDTEENCKVVRQRIYVKQRFYDLQEIYGISEARQAENGDVDFSADCVVCLTNRKDTTVLPCRHFCMCSDCAKTLLKRTRICPMCRLGITSVLQIQVNQSQDE